MYHEGSRRLQDRFDSRRIADRLFPNCPRYIHPMQLVNHSVYAPRQGYVPPEPDWKRMPVFQDALPRRTSKEQR
jgi:hypothetical protein